MWGSAGVYVWEATVQCRSAMMRGGNEVVKPGLWGREGSGEREETRGNEHCSV